MEKKTIENQEEILKSIMNQSSTAEIIMMDLALRERNRSATNLIRTKARLVKQGEKIVEQDFVSFWKALDAAGFGRLTLTKRGKAIKFEWYYGLKRIARAAIEGTDRVGDKLPARMKDTPPSITASVKASLTHPAPLRFYVPLRKGHSAQLDIPGDTTREELDKIIEVLRYIK